MNEPHNFNAEIVKLALADIRKSVSPKLIHCIMNAVAANDCANALLAIGAKPVMADCSKETAEITLHSNAVVFNMGMYSPEKEMAMLNSGKAANKKFIPIVLDPVGVHASQLRKEGLKKLLKNIRFSVIKGNLHEIAEIAGQETFSRFGKGGAHFLDTAVKTAAKKTGAVCVLTGEIDFISNGERTYCIKNGSPRLGAVTGTGCMTGALIGAFTCVTTNLNAALYALTLMNICGETAAQKHLGTGSFRVGLMDMLSQIPMNEIEKRLNFFEYKGEDLW